MQGPPNQRLSISRLVHTLPKVDEDVQTAAEALAGLSSTSPYPTQPPVDTQVNINDDNDACKKTANDPSWTHNTGPVDPDSPTYTHTLPTSQHFMQRVSSIPLVNKSMQNISMYYEAVTNASKVVKYSAETVEAMGKPVLETVLDRLEPALKPLDRFACSQLDRLEHSFPSFMRPEQSSQSATARPSLDLLQPPFVPLHVNPSSLDTSSSHGPFTYWEDSPQNPLHYTMPTYASSSPTESTLAQPYHPEFQSNESASTSSPAETSSHVEHKPRSRWSAVVAGVQGNLGAMVISDDVMRALKYCLQWLQYATNHIDQQITILKDYLTQLFGGQPTPPRSPGLTSTDMVPSNGVDLAGMIARIRRELVETVRRVVDVVGRYAGAYLPGEARQSVKGFILSLPGKWASINTNDVVPPTPTPVSPGQHSADQSLDSVATLEAQKVIIFGEESANMLKGVQSIFSQTVEGAERVLGRVVDVNPMQELPNEAQSMLYDQTTPTDTHKPEDSPKRKKGKQRMDDSVMEVDEGYGRGGMDLETA